MKHELVTYQGRICIKRCGHADQDQALLGVNVLLKSIIIVIQVEFSS